MLFLNERTTGLDLQSGRDLWRIITEFIIVLLVSRYLFGVVNHGRYLSVMLLIALGAFEFAGIGLLIASRAKTLEALSGLMNLAMVPMWIGSGIFLLLETLSGICAAAD